MKLLVKFFIVVLVIGFASCRDTKKEEEEAKAAIEQIEAVEAEIQEINADLEIGEDELEDALKELDSI